MELKNPPYLDFKVELESKEDKTTRVNFIVKELGYWQSTGEIIAERNLLNIGLTFDKNHVYVGGGYIIHPEFKNMELDDMQTSFINLIGKMYVAMNTKSKKKRRRIK